MTFESIAQKLDIVRENLERLEALPQSSYAEFSGDFRNLDSALHRLQSAIQALIDVASYVVSARGLGVPQTSLESLEKLESAGCSPQGRPRDSHPASDFETASCTSTIASTRKSSTRSSPRTAAI